MYENTLTPLAYSPANAVHFSGAIVDHNQLRQDLSLLRKQGGVGIAPKAQLNQAYGDVDDPKRFIYLCRDAGRLGFECTKSGLDIIFTPRV